MFSLLTALWPHISKRRRIQFAILLILLILAAFSEIISIGAILPFLAVLTAPDRIFQLPAAKPFIQLFGFTNANQLLLPLTIGFGIAALLSGAMRLLLLWANTGLSYATGADLSISIFRRTLYQPYAVHVARNSSEIINGISSKTNSIISSLVNTLNLISSGMILVAIFLTLVSVDPVIALSAFGGFGLLYGLIISFTKKTLFDEQSAYCKRID